MISTELWRRRFSEDPHIIGKTATLASTAYTIIGVLPTRFQFPVPGVDVWLTAPTEWPLMSAKSRVDSPFLSVFGRLKPGSNLNQANAEMKVIRHRYAIGNPDLLAPEPKTASDVMPMKEDLVSDVRAMLWMLFGAVGFVLLIACANVAGLLLARATGRAREFAVRSALGAARRRLIGQLLAESVLLSICGGIFGVLLAAWILRAIPLITSFDLPRAGEIHLDWLVLAFAAALSIATGVLFGLAPSIGASRPDLIQVLRASGEAGNRRKEGLFSGLNVRGLLLIGQVALSIVLLIGAALLIKSVSNLRGVDVGFNSSHLLTMQVPLPPLRYDTNQKRATFFEDLVRRVESIPGVRGAAAAMFLPMQGYAGTPVQEASKPPLPLNQRMIATIWTTTPGYFRTLGIALRRGREFNEHDTADAQRVAIIDEALARALLAGISRRSDPIGQRLLIGGVNKKPAEIIGIVAHVQEALENSTWPESVYVSMAQNAPPFAMLAIRTPGDPLLFTKAVREQVRALDPDQPVAQIRSMDDLVEEQVGQRRLLVILLGLRRRGAVARLDRNLRHHRVLGGATHARTGNRRALGAQQSDILRLVVGQGLRLALVGIAVGIAGALALTRLMKALLFHVSATDPATFAIVAALFLLVALAASYIPARRATRIDPMAALRI